MLYSSSKKLTTSERIDQYYSKVVEDFIGRAKKLESDLLRWLHVLNVLFFFFGWVCKELYLAGSFCILIYLFFVYVSHLMFIRIVPPIGADWTREPQS